MGGRIRPPTTSAEPARAASHLNGRSDSGGGAKRLDSTGTEATPLLHLPTRFPEDPLKQVWVRLEPIGSAGTGGAMTKDSSEPRWIRGCGRATGAVAGRDVGTR